MIYTIPIQPIPSQSISVLIEDQSFVFQTRELEGRQYASISLNGDVMCENVLLVNRSYIARCAYKGMQGDFFVLDTQGDEAPNYTGWGSRWLLAFKSEN